MKKFTLTLVIMIAMILLLPLYTIAAEEYDEDPTPYDTEEWYRGDTGDSLVVCKKTTDMATFDF